MSPAEKAFEKTDAVTSYVKYSILKGEHYTDKYDLVRVKTSKLSFKVKFDNTAIYTTVKTAKQTDIILRKE